MFDHDVNDQDGILNAPREAVELPPEVKAFDAFLAKPENARLWEAAREALSRSLEDETPEDPAIREAYVDALANLDGANDSNRAELVKVVAGARQKLTDMLIDMRPLPIRKDWETAAPPRGFLVEGRIPLYRFGLITGDGDAGKTRIVLDLARAVCQPSETELKWLTWPVDNGHPDQSEGPPVVWCTWEDEPDEFRRRLGRDNWIEVHERLHVVDLAEHGPLWAPKAGSGHVSTMATITPVGQMVREYCESLGAKLLVIDPLAAAFASNENDRGLVRAFVSSWDGWARRTECSLVVISHPPKDRNLKSTSGSTDWVNASRWVAQLTFAKESDDVPHGCRVLEFTKGNYGPKAPGAIIKWLDGKEAEAPGKEFGFNWHGQHGLLPKSPADTNTEGVNEGGYKVNEL